MDSSAMRIALGNDHAGFRMKEFLKRAVEGLGHEVIDMGSTSEESVDYPDHAHAVAEAVARGEADLGVLICGSGNGVNITANKHPGIRSALAWTADVARLAREHNDANVLALPARFVDEQAAFGMVKTFLETQFEGGRHQRRVGKIERPNIE
jgi:ribose 5-phosphate isomerase B